MNRWAIAVVLGLAAGQPGIRAVAEAADGGIPRTADGKPNLAAPAPRMADGKPDLSGLWQLGLEIGYAANITADLAPADIQPWARALSRSGWRISGRTIRKSPAACPVDRVTSPAAVCRRSSRRQRCSRSCSRISPTVRSFSTAAHCRAIRIPLDGLFGRTLGRRHARRRKRRLQRQDLARLRRPSAQRGVANHRRYRRRDFGHLELQVTLNDPAVYAEAADGFGGRHPRRGHGTSRVRVRRKRKGSRASRRQDHGREGGRGRPRILATYAGVYEVVSAPPRTAREASRRSSPSRSRMASC